MAAKYTMRSSNRLKGSGEKSLVAPTIACNRPGHDSVFTVFADPRRRAAVFRPRRLACRAELLRAGRRGGGEKSMGITFVPSPSRNRTRRLPSTAFVFRKKRRRSTGDSRAR